MLGSPFVLFSCDFAEAYRPLSLLVLKS